LQHNDIDITACTETSQFGASEILFNDVDNWLEEFQRERKDSYHYTTSSHDGDSTRSDSETPMQKLCNEVLNESVDTRGRIDLGPVFDDADNTSEAVWASQQQPLIHRPQPTTNYSPSLPSIMPLTNENRAKRPSSDISNSSSSKTPAKKRNTKSQLSPSVNKSRSRKRMDNALNKRWQSKMALRDALAAFEKAKTQLNECRSRYDMAKSLVQSTAKEEWESLLTEDTPWNDMFHQLKKYKEETGDCNVKQNFGAEDNKISPELVKLSAWVGKNRKEGKARGRGCAVTLPKVGSAVKQGKSCDENFESENDDQLPPNCESDANKSSSIDTCNHSTLEERDDSSVFEDIDPDSIQADPYKEIALDDIGFDWNPRNSRWNSMYEELKAYKEKYGNTLVPHANFGLGSWVKRQQVQYSIYSKGDAAKSELTEDRVRLLNELGFIWSRRNNTWNSNFERLERWKEIHGNCNVPDDPNDRETAALHKWVTDQRIHYKRYIAEKGDNENGEDPDSGKKNKKKLPSLNEEKISKLESIGFEFDARDAKWLQKLEVLKRYKELHGDFLVPTNYVEDPTLANWVASQRAQYNLYKKGSKTLMTERRLKILQDIGFSFSVNQERQKAAKLDKVIFDKKPWEEKFKDYLFHIFSNKGLESIQKNNPFLAEWVTMQRRELQQWEGMGENDEDDENGIRHRLHLMKVTKSFLSFISNKDRAQPLTTKHTNCSCPNKDEIYWERQYGQLAAWYIKYGTYSSKGMPSKMKKFISRQQEQYRLLNDGVDSEMTVERVEKLDEIFFPFDKASSMDVPEDDVAASRRNRSWEEYRADLAISYIQKGNYDSQALDDLELRRWATEQKRQHKLYLSGKQSMLTYDQIQKLIDIKFISKRPKHLSWGENCAQLMAFRIQHGHFDVSKANSIQLCLKKCKIPKQLYTSNAMKNLSDWVNRLRKQYMQSPESLVTCNVLTQDQIIKLNSVGFPWTYFHEEEASSSHQDKDQKVNSVNSS